MVISPKFQSKTSYNNMDAIAHREILLSPSLLQQQLPQWLLNPDCSRKGDR
ncbi:MAG: hypothetical protein KME40_01815 [Komarekiella atlantica HA4396-MV6]|nr:hypothetical protein [Komarekiella atlantica HA4396-MV6]